MKKRMITGVFVLGIFICWIRQIVMGIEYLYHSFCGINHPINTTC